MKQQAVETTANRMREKTSAKLTPAKSYVR